MGRQPCLWSSLDPNSMVGEVISMEGEVNSMVGMDLMVEAMDRLAVADLPTQLQGGLRPCPYKVFSKSVAIDETNLM